MKYFAYGSNMMREQMFCRCPGVTPGKITALYGYRFIINARGYASIVRDDDSRCPALSGRSAAPAGKTSTSTRGASGA